MATSRDQWIFVWPCDCPFGVMEAYLAADETAAFEEMFEDMPEAADGARARGLVARRISWEEYDKIYFPKMTSRCEHDRARV